MKNLYRQVQRQLSKLSEVEPKGNALKRINNLSGFISGIIRKGSSHLPDIGSGLVKNIDANSKTIAAKRFVSNKWTDSDTHYLPYVTAFIRGIVAFTFLPKGLILVIDGSQTGKNNAILMVSMLWGNRGIPICWYVKSGSKGHFKTADHVKVLKQAMKILLPIIGDQIPITVLGDGEFDSIDVQKLCLSQGWNYVLRTACDTVLFENGERFQARDVTPDDTQNCIHTQNVAFTNDRFKYVNFVCWHDKKRHEEPIYLISNLLEVGDIIEYYDQRYSIECLFKDLKSTSFQLHKTRLKDPQEVSNLVVIAALAFLLLTIFAIRYDKPKWRKKVQRVRKDRKVLSFFTFALRLLHLFLENDVGFSFSFQFSKNLFSFQTSSV